MSDSSQDHQPETKTAPADRSEGTGGKRGGRKLRSCFWFLLCCGLILGGSLAVAQMLWPTPEVDPDLETPLQITQGTVDSGSQDDPDSTNNDSDSSESGNSPDEADTETDKPPARLTDRISADDIATADHPLEPLMKIADLGVEHIDATITDYTANVVSRVRLGKRLGPERIMAVKIRHKQNSETTTEPFSVYTRFLKPRKMIGQEAIWIEGEREDKILAHTTGFMNVKTFHLEPLSSIAMNGSRHPIFKIGFRNLIVQMKEYGINDMKHKECEVQIQRNVMVGKHSCTMLQIIHPQFREHFEYHIAKIYLDDERQIPIGYEGYLWPRRKGEDPPLLESYFYTDIELNVGLTDADFDPANEAYDFPDW